MSDGLLAGVRVLDFSRVIAGPHGTRILADFGAEVIKVEEPGHGDHTRSEIAWGRNVRFVGYNYGKKSISVDLKKPAGLDLIKALIPKVDAVVENFRPGVMRRLGLGYDDLRPLNPRLIYLSISGFGQTGAASHRPLHAPNAHAISGMIALGGEPARQLPGAIGDPVTAVHGVAAICAALYKREKTGLGQQIDIAILDVVFSMMGPQAEMLTMDGGSQRQGPQGNQSPNTVPSGMFKGRDGYIVTGGGVEDTQWRALSRTIGRADLADQPHSWRRDNADYVYSLIGDWINSFEHVKDAEEALIEGGVVVGRVRPVEEAVRDPILRERNMVQPMDDVLTGPFEATGIPFHFSENPPNIAGLPPGIGEHNEEVFGGILGLSDLDLKRLYEDGVIFAEPRPAALT